METFMMWIAYGFEILVGIFAIGLFTMILTGIFDEPSNDQAKKVANYILNINEEDFR